MSRSSEPLTRNWNAFFSSLACAEQAAAVQCERIAEGFEARGDLNLASRYREYAGEERGHFRIVSAVCREFHDPTARARQAYDGGLMNPDPSILERLAVVHIGFEPSALAYLGYLFRYADELLGEARWASEIKAGFGAILREEVTHIHFGKNVILSEWAAASPGTQATVLKALRRHRAFLSLGLGSFFRGLPNASVADFVPAMVKDYRLRIDSLTRDLVV